MFVVLSVLWNLFNPKNDVSMHYVTFGGPALPLGPLSNPIWGLVSRYDFVPTSLEGISRLGEYKLDLWNP